MIRPGMSLFKVSFSRYTVMTIPVSMEHEDGPKKVKTVRLLITMAVSNLPHAIVFSILKLQCHKSVGVSVLQKEQTGKIKVTGGGAVVGPPVVSAGLASLRS